MRRCTIFLLSALAVLAFAAPAQATTRVPFVAPPRSYELVGACPFTISAQEREGHPGYLTLDGSGEVIKVEFQGSYDTVLSSSFGELAFETIGSTVVTANGDGTWTMVQKGTGLAVVPSTDPDGPALVWFTGRITSVGEFDAKTLSFVPRSQTITGTFSNVCDMLVTGLKTRHTV